MAIYSDAEYERFERLARPDGLYPWGSVERLGEDGAKWLRRFREEAQARGIGFEVERGVVWLAFSEELRRQGAVERRVVNVALDNHAVWNRATAAERLAADPEIPREAFKRVIVRFEAACQRPDLDTRGRHKAAAVLDIARRALALRPEPEASQVEPEAPRRIALASIVIEGSESNAVEPGARFETWADAETAIRRIAETAPVGGAYRKTWFLITWADGESYSGRIDVQRRCVNVARPLAEHVRGYSARRIGRERVPGMSWEDSAAMNREFDKLCPDPEENRAFLASVLDTRDLGE